MEVDGVPECLGPEPSRGSSLSSEGRRQYVNGAYGTLRNWIEVMIVRWTCGGVERSLGSEVVKREGFELPLVIAMEAPHPGTSERLAVFADRNTYERVELSYGSFSGVDNFVLGLKELNRDKSRIFVDEKGGVLVSAESGDVPHFFKIDM